MATDGVWSRCTYQVARDNSVRNAGVIRWVYTGSLSCRWHAVNNNPPGHRCCGVDMIIYRNQLLVVQVNPNIRKEKWTASEDRQLASLVAEHGNRWADIARQYVPPLLIERSLRFHM